MIVPHEKVFIERINFQLNLLVLLYHDLHFKDGLKIENIKDFQIFIALDKNQKLLAIS